MWNLRRIKSALGPEICDLSLSCHVFLGCDTTLHLYNLNKGKILSLLIENESARKDAAVFNDSQSSKTTLAAAGERILVRLYKGATNESLDSLRLKFFYHKISSSTSFVQRSLDGMKPCHRRVMQQTIIFIAFFTKWCSGWALTCNRNSGAGK